MAGLMKLVLMLVLVVGLSSFADQALGATITLKNGSVIKGSIVRMNENVIVIDTANMGRLKIKRRTVKSISEGDDETKAKQGNGQVNININNTQDNNQTVEQNVEQNVEVNTGDKKEDKLEWQQGLYTRLAFGGGSLSASLENGDWPETDPYSSIDGSGLSMVWDLVGFRSASWWAVSLTAIGGSSEGVGDWGYSSFFIGPRFDWNFLKDAHGNQALSQFNLGIAFGSASLSFYLDEERQVRYSGSGTALFLGYDYLMSKYVGISLQAYIAGGTLDSSELDNETTAVENGIDLGVSDQAVSMGMSGITLGILVNFDL